MSVFLAQGEDQYQDTPADLLMSWGKGGLAKHLLVGWGHIRPYRGQVRSGTHIFLVGAGRRGMAGGSRWGRGHYNERGGAMIRIW